jgi:glycosyltransferase involved in cell wall biosynthesis
MSVLISHSSVAPFVQQAARSLLEAGQLDRFITTLRYDAGSRPQDWACRVSRRFGFDLATQLRRRTVTEIPLSAVESHPWGEIARLASSRFDRSGRLTDLVWERTEPAFDRLVARQLGPQHTAVYGFEYSSRATFERARELGIRAAYDMPAPEPRFVQSLLDAEIERFPELQTPYHDHTTKREERRIARRRAEWECADIVIAASQFTRDSFARAGLDVAKVRIVPYGAPPVAARDVALGGPPADQPLRFLWAGTFSIRKGAHYLLEAWRDGGFGRHARLQVFGAQGLPQRLLQPAPEGVEFHGSIPRDQLMARYAAGDALLFPTLCDGFGMVATEAWSRGVPVVTTDCAGVSDLLEPFHNGLLIKARSAAAIQSALEWCLTHRGELHAMREGARATAAGWQWQDYRRMLADTLRQAGLFQRDPAPAFRP